MVTKFKKFNCDKYKTQIVPKLKTQIVREKKKEEKNCDIYQKSNYDEIQKFKL